MKKILVIVGPTGVGKTSLSVNLAKKFHGEIISGDSMQVYKEMSIGTAKIKEKEKKNIPHYLVDTFHFDEEYNVKKFQSLSRKYIDEISSHGHLPIICGGTGLYIKSSIYDYKFLEQKQDDEFISYLKCLSSDQLWGLLKVIDPKVCETIHHNNRQRIIRALSMAHDGEKKSDIVDAQKHEPIYDSFIVGLTMERGQLYERINNRVDIMMDEGLFDEIDRLVKSKENIWNLQSFKGIGYKEWIDYYTGNATKEECVEKIKKNSRNFAKRQYTWFRNQMQVHWYDVTKQDYIEQIRKDIELWLKK